MKCQVKNIVYRREKGALFTRAWIEISARLHSASSLDIVALFTRAWIEMLPYITEGRASPVALFTRAWIEMQDMA